MSEDPGEWQPVREFVCKTCGRSVVLMCGYSWIVECMECTTVPGWHLDPAMRNVLDKEGWCTVPEAHHEYCDTRDPMIKDKPCNCRGRVSPRG